LQESILLSVDEQRQFRESPLGACLRWDRPVADQRTLSSRLPALFQWPSFHTALANSPQAPKVPDRLELVPSNWSKEFRERGPLFLTFFREWIVHVQFMGKVGTFLCRPMARY
jgi:hypothetical protein